MTQSTTTPDALLPPSWLDQPFDQTPDSALAQAFRVKYVHLQTRGGGDLYVTSLGWPHVRHLLPEQWYTDKWFAREGVRLPGSTGTVFRVPTRPINGRHIELVVKFSRVGQEVPLVIASDCPEQLSPELIANARFNSPFEEFGLVMDLRRGGFGPPDLRIGAQRPLAIYVPSDEVASWRLGRTGGRFRSPQQSLARDQRSRDMAIELDIKRDYVLLYAWITGLNAEDAYSAGLIGRSELHALTQRVTAELSDKGFRVLDNKPKHYILRALRDRNDVLRRNDQIAYALVDFELLARNEAHQSRYETTQRARYWEFQTHGLAHRDEPLPPGRYRTNILGVNYVFGRCPNGSLIWVVGEDHHLFEYFLPDRWRRTARVKLALSNEVYRTRTRDNIHVVYRRSRVGERPPLDPFYDSNRRIREHGYNSPFEEVALAMYLRRLGMATIYPRAIYRTSHESVKSLAIFDPQRYHSHADYLTAGPGPEPVLSAYFDYYIVWGYWRGVDPQDNRHPGVRWGFTDPEKAADDGLMTRQSSLELLASIRQRLTDAAIPHERFDDFEFLLCFDDGNQLIKDDQGRLKVSMCLDALSAHEYSLLSEQQYRQLIENLQARLADVGGEILNCTGSHILLSMDPDGRFALDPDGEPRVTLCNFELMASRYCLLPTPDTSP